MTKDPQLLIDALDKIAYTVKHLQDEARASGGQLDGIAAFQIANDPRYLKKIAAEALASYAGSAEPPTQAEAEREVMIQAFDKVRKLFEMRSWIMEGRGCYPYNDDRYREEVRYLYDEFDALQKDVWSNIKSKTFEYRAKIIIDYRASLEPSEHSIKYLKCEYDQQIDRMRKLGLLVDEYIFEQCVNTVLARAEKAAGSAEEEKEEFGEWLERCCDPHSTSVKEPKKKDPWISVEDHPLVIDTKLGWECTEAGEGEFLAAIQVHDNSTNKDHWWIRHCVIEDMIGLCVVGDDENTPAGWDAKDVQYYCPLPEPPAATNQEGDKK